MPLLPCVCYARRVYYNMLSCTEGRALCSLDIAGVCVWCSALVLCRIGSPSNRVVGTCRSKTTPACFGDRSHTASCAHKTLTYNCHHCCVELLYQMEIARLEGESPMSIDTTNSINNNTDHTSNSVANSSSAPSTPATTTSTNSSISSVISNSNASNSSSTVRVGKRTPGYLPVCRASDPICPIARIPKSEGYVFKTKVLIELHI